MTYLTYLEYVEYGGTACKPTFETLEFRARKRIDRLTSCRVQKMKSVPEDVKRCMMDIIAIDSKVGAVAQVDSPVVTSFNTDGYSETYGKALSAEDAEKSMTSAIKSMLWGVTDDRGVPLLYRGVEV